VDPEQIYQEVLQEEQTKGSAAPVAEGRAKSARQRAVSGSPHPKEAKWWPGAQPQFEGDGAAPAAAAPEEEAPEEEKPEPAAEEPAAEAAPPPAAAEPVEEVAPEPAVAEAPEARPDAAAPQAPADAPPPAAERPPADAASSAADEPAVAAAVAAPARPSGVTHGTPAGNRLRPEDGVSTTAQFEGQQAMYDRRKLIDELIASGVPTISAEDAGRTKSPGLAILYILIPLLAVFIVVGQEDSTTEASGSETGVEAPDGEGGGLTVVAEGLAFDTSEIPLAAGEATPVTFDNADTAEHNIAIYANPEDGIAFTDPLFEGEIIQGGQSTTYDISIDKPGDFYFQCDVHPNMNGTATAQ
jgi:plastocyanin